MVGAVWPSTRLPMVGHSPAIHAVLLNDDLLELVVKALVATTDSGACGIPLAKLAGVCTFTHSASRRFFRCAVIADFAGFRQFSLNTLPASTVWNVLYAELHSRNVVLELAVAVNKAMVVAPLEPRLMLRARARRGETESERARLADVGADVLTPTGGVRALRIAMARSTAPPSLGAVSGVGVAAAMRLRELLGPERLELAYERRDLLRRRAALPPLTAALRATLNGRRARGAPTTRSAAAVGVSGV